MRESERVSVPVLRRKRPGVGIDKMKCVTVGDKLRCSGKVGGVRFVRPMCEEVCVSVRVCVRACVHARACNSCTHARRHAENPTPTLELSTMPRFDGSSDLSRSARPDTVTLTHPSAVGDNWSHEASSPMHHRAPTSVEAGCHAVTAVRVWGVAVQSQASSDKVGATGNTFSRSGQTHQVVTWMPSLLPLRIGGHGKLMRGVGDVVLLRRLPAGAEPRVLRRAG